MNEENCLFCKIVSRKIPSKIVFENEDNLAFLDIFPISEGHTIIIPKDHFQNLEAIPVKNLKKLIEKVKEVATTLKDKLKFDGYNILQNNFPSAGQEIPHIHFHVIPRNKNDGKFSLKTPKNQASEEELDKILKKLKK